MATITTTTPTGLLPVAEAAAAMGISVSAVRRGLKSGRFQGQRQPTPQGFVWLVEIPAADDDRVSDDRVSDRVRTSRVRGDRSPGRRVGDDRVSDQAPPAGPEAPQTAIQAQRAEEMARYTETLLRPLHARLEAQAERIGRLELELEQARAQLAEGGKEAAVPTAAPTPQRRRWWQRWLWGRQEEPAGHQAPVAAQG